MPKNQSNTRIHVGAVSLSKTNAMYFFRNQAEGKYKQVKFCLGPEGRGKLGTYFLVLKDPETNMPTYILVLFGSTRLSEVTHIFYSVVLLYMSAQFKHFCFCFLSPDRKSHCLLIFLVSGKDYFPYLFCRNIYPLQSFDLTGHICHMTVNCISFALYFQQFSLLKAIPRDSERSNNDVFELNILTNFNLI